MVDLNVQRTMITGAATAPPSIYISKQDQITSFESGSASPSGGASCPADGSPDVEWTGTTAIDAYISASDTTEGGGTSWTVGAADVTICKVAMRLKENGDCSGSGFKLSIMDTTLAVVNNGTSDEVNGNIAATYDWIYFTWSGNKPTLTAGIKYYFTVHRTDPNAVSEYNYWKMTGCNQGAGGVEDYVRWAWTSPNWAIQGTNDEFDMDLRIYYYD